MKRITIMLSVLFSIAACGGDGLEQPPAAPSPAVSSTQIREYVEYVDFEFQGTNLYFFCHGTTGVYMAEGDSDPGFSGGVSAVLDHPECGSR